MNEYFEQQQKPNSYLPKKKKKKTIKKFEVQNKQNDSFDHLLYTI